MWPGMQGGGWGPWGGEPPPDDPFWAESAWVGEFTACGSAMDDGESELDADAG